MPVIGGNTIDHNVAYAGQVADLQLRNKISKLNQTGESIAYGKGLVTEDEQSAKLPIASSTAAEFNGVVVYELNRARRFGQTGAPSGQDMTLITKGVVWVTTLDTVTKDTPVYLRTGGVDAGDFSGVDNDSVLIPGTKFLTPGSAGDLVKISLGGLGLSDSPAPVPTPSAFVARMDGDQAWELSEQVVDVDDMDGLSLKGYFGDEDGIFFTNGPADFPDFRIYSGSGRLFVQLGGDFNSSLTDVMEGDTEFLFSGESTMSYLVDGVELLNITLNKGNARQSNPTKIGGYIESNGDVTQGRVGYIKDVVISQGGVVKYQSSLTDKDAGAVQVSEVGSVTATMVNYDASVWVPDVEQDWLMVLGSNQRWRFDEKLIDVDNLDGTIIEAEFTEDEAGALIAQSTGPGTGVGEFQYFKSGEIIGIRIGSQYQEVGRLTSVGIHKLDFHDGLLDITINGVNVYSGVAPDNGYREAGVTTTLCGYQSSFYRRGGAKNFKITKDGVITYENSLSTRSEAADQQPIVGTAIATLGLYSHRAWESYYIRDEDITTDSVILFAGASIMERSFDQTTRTETAYATQGLDITSYCRAASGDTSIDMRIRAESAIREFSKVTKNKVAFVHGPGNDVSLYGPYPGGVTDIVDNMNALLTAYKAAGFKLILTPISYRIPPASNPTEPYNVNVIDSIINGYADHLVDMYTFTLTSGDAYFGLAGGDGIHPSDPDGEILTVNYVVDNTYQYIQGIQ